MPCRHPLGLWGNGSATEGQPRNLMNPPGWMTLMRLLLVLVLMGSLLSGCTALGDGPDLMTAKQAVRPADRAAENWADDAILMDAETQELDDEARREARDEIADEREELREARDDGDISESDYDNLTELFDVFSIVVEVNDDDVGDGRASLWAFTYQSESKQDAYLVAVGHGKVVYKESMRSLFGGDEFDFEDFLEDEQLGEWRVDSDEASTAARLNEDYARICGGSNVVSFMSLNQDDGLPVWSIGVSTQGSGDEQDDFAYLAVDAVNGSLIVAETVVPDDFEDVEDLLFQEGGQMEGDIIGSAQFTTSEAFEVMSDGHALLAVEVSVSPATPQPIHVTVTDPEGASSEFDVAMTTSPFSARQHVLIESVPTGVYSVELEVPLSLASSYTVSWCTDGIPTAEGDFRPRACTIIDDAVEDGGGAGARGETLSRLHRWLAVW